MRRSRLLVAGLVAVGAGWGCTPDPGPEEEAWSPPVWEGDGLPPGGSGGYTGDGRGEDDSGGSGGGGGGDEEGALDGLYIVDGVFGVMADGTGYLVLSAEPVGCAEIMGYDSFPYGAYILLRGGEGAGPTGGWAGEYPWCGEPPCMRDGFWQNAGASGDLPGEERIMVLEAGAHALTASWGFGQNGGDPLVIDNCQDMAGW